MQLLADELSRGSRELAERMGAVFSGMEQTGDRFAAVLDSASATFRDEIGRVQSHIGSGLTTALAALAESTNRSSRESEALVEKLSEGATSFKTSVEAGGSSFVSELGRGVQSIDAIVERLGQSVGHLGSIVDRTAVFAEQSSMRTGERIGELQNTIAQIDRSFQKVSDATVPFGQAADQVRTSIDLLRATQASVQSKLSSFQAAADAIERASAGLTNTFDRDMGRMSESLSSTTDRLKEAISLAANESELAGARLADAVRVTLTEYEHRFAGIDKELQAALTIVVDTFAKTYEEIRTRVDVVDHQMAQSVNKLVSVNERFDEHVESISDAIAKLPRALAS